MTGLQIILTLEFILFGILNRVGSNLQIRLAHSLFPDEIYGGFRVPNRILKKIDAEYKTDKLVMRKLKQAKAIKVVGLIILTIFVLTFFYSF